MTALKEILEALFRNQLLTGAEAKQAMLGIARGEFNAAQVAAFLAVFRLRSLTVAELQGFRAALLELCKPVNLAAYQTLDVCGTGGDGKGTFNISTLAALVAAGAGQKVAKHGNYAFSSGCGSSNMLEELGVKFFAEQGDLERSVAEAGICFLHAPLFHPALKNVAPIRKDLRVRTIFNILGPLVNPASPSAQFTGVCTPELVRLYAYLLLETDCRFMVVHALEGYDEVSLTGPAKIVSRTEELLLEPRDLGLVRAAPAELAGRSSIAENARLCLRILEGQGTRAQADVVVANAGLALHCAQPDLSLPEALGRARESLVSGRARAVLSKVCELSAR